MLNYSELHHELVPLLRGRTFVHTQSDTSKLQQSWGIEINASNVGRRMHSLALHLMSELASNSGAAHPFSSFPWLPFHVYVHYGTQRL